MKLLVLFFVIGCASAAFYDALEDAADQVVLGFLEGMDKGLSLKEVIGSNYVDEADQIENDMKTQLGKSLKETLERILHKIQESVDHGKEVAKEFVEKIKDITEKLQVLGEDAGGKAKELIERLKGKARDWFQEMILKLVPVKRSLGELFENLIEKLNLRTVVENLKQNILEKLNIEGIRDYVKKVFGELSSTGETLLRTLKERGIQAVRDLVTFILPRRVVEPKELTIKVINENHVEKRSVAIAKAACMLIKYIGLGWTHSKIQGWIDANMDSGWRGILSKALAVGVPALKFLLGSFCYAAGPVGPAQVTNYSILELWQKVRSFFKDAGVQLQERFFRFADWLKGVIKNGVQEIQENIQKVKEVAREVIESGKTLTKEAAEEALEFFRPYKEDLGALWEELVETVKNTLGVSS